MVVSRQLKLTELVHLQIAAQRAQAQRALAQRALAHRLGLTASAHLQTLAALLFLLKQGVLECVPNALLVVAKPVLIL